MLFIPGQDHLWPTLSRKGTVGTQLAFYFWIGPPWPTLSGKGTLRTQLAFCFWTGPTLAHFIQKQGPWWTQTCFLFLDRTDFGPLYPEKGPWGPNLLFSLWTGPTLAHIIQKKGLWGPNLLFCFVLDRTDFSPLYPRMGHCGPTWGPFLSQLDSGQDPLLAHFIRNIDRLWPQLDFFCLLGTLLVQVLLDWGPFLVLVSVSHLFEWNFGY